MVKKDNRSSAKDGEKEVRSFNRQRRGRKKVCPFCVDKVEHIDYKEISKLRKFISERGKILPKRISGNCAKHQRQLTNAIKRARHVALMPFSSD